MKFHIILTSRRNSSFRDNNRAQRYRYQPRLQCDRCRCTANMNGTSLAPPTPPLPPPPLSPSVPVVHIGFEPCRYAGYDGRTCITIDRRIYNALIAVVCEPNSNVDCIEPSTKMSYYVHSKVRNLGSFPFQLWQLNTDGPLGPNRRYYEDQNSPNAPPTVNTSSEYFFALKEGFRLAPGDEVASSVGGTTFLQNYNEPLKVVWIAPSPSAPPPSAPPLLPDVEYNCSTIHLQRGWQLVSFNCLVPGDTGLSLLQQVNFSFADKVITTVDSRVYGMGYTLYGWYGSLAQDLGLVYQTGYKLFFNGSFGAIEQRGVIQNPLLNVSLQRGWNYIGHTPVSECSIHDLEVVQGSWSVADKIITRTNRRVMASGFMGNYWYGSLEYLSPGVGYQLFANESIVFRYPLHTRMEQQGVGRQLSENAGTVAPQCNESMQWIVAPSDEMVSLLYNGLATIQPIEVT